MSTVTLIVRLPAPDKLSVATLAPLNSTATFDVSTSSSACTGKDVPAVAMMEVPPTERVPGNERADESAFSNSAHRALILAGVVASLMRVSSRSYSEVAITNCISTERTGSW